MDKRTTFTISLPPDLARRADELARRESRTRSELFREALRQYINRLERWEQLTALARAQNKRPGISEEEIDRIVMERRRARAAG